MGGWKSTAGHIIRYIGGIVFDTAARFGESGEGEGGRRSRTTVGSSVFPEVERVHFQPNLLVHLGVTVERWEDGAILVRVDDEVSEEPLFGLSVWSQGETLQYTVDSPSSIKRL